MDTTQTPHPDSLPRTSTRSSAPPRSSGSSRFSGASRSSEPSHSSAPPRFPRLLLLLGTLSCLLTAALGLFWLLAPALAPFDTSSPPPPLFELVGAGPLFTLLVVVALLGAVAGAVGMASRPAAGPARTSRPVTAVLVVVGGLQVVLFGLGFASFMTLAATGYLIAVSMPLVLVTICVLLVVHGGRARWAVGVPLLVLLAAGAVAGAEVLADLAGKILPGLLSQGGEVLTTAHFVAVGAVWAAICGAVLRSSGHLERLGAWTVRRRRMLTLLAACGPLPYALLRLTWLTPWPVLGGAAAEVDVATRVWGLALSLGAWLGVLLTIGLIRPWGEVFPRWFPVVGGRPVPVATAAVPGFTVAALLCFAAVPVVLSASTLGFASALGFALIFPCWFWGPALALAVWGYVGHRRSTIVPRGEAPASARMGA